MFNSPCSSNVELVKSKFLEETFQIKPEWILHFLNQINNLLKVVRARSEEQILDCYFVTFYSENGC